MSNSPWMKGTYWALTLLDNSFGFCRLLTFPHVEFLKLNAREAVVDATVLDASGVLFAIAVHRARLRRWITTRVQTRLPVTDEMPIVIKPNASNFGQCSIRDPDGNRREALPDECVGLAKHVRRMVWWKAAKSGLRTTTLSRMSQYLQNVQASYASSTSSAFVGIAALSTFV